MSDNAQNHRAAAMTATPVQPIVRCVFFGCDMKCLLHLGVHAKDGIAGIEREIEIPFCPVAGLEIGGIVNPNGNLSCGKVASVQWDAETGKLTAHLENDNNEADDETLEEKLADWGDGWKVRIYR